MDDWKSTDIGVLLRNSIDIQRHKRLWLIYVMFFLCCTAIYLVGISKMSMDATKDHMRFAWFIFLVLCLPFLVHGYKKAFVYDKNPMAYVLTEVTLKEAHDGRDGLKFFALRFQDETGYEFVADTDAIFSTNGIARLQYKACVGKKARIAYHKGIQKAYILEIL